MAQYIGTLYFFCMILFLYVFLLFLYHWCIVYLLNMYLLHNTLVFSYSCDLYSNFYMSHAYVLLLLLSGFTVVQLFNYLGLGWLLCSSSIVRFHVCNKHSHIHHMSIPVISIYKILIHIYIYNYIYIIIYILLSIILLYLCFNGFTWCILIILLSYLDFGLNNAINAVIWSRCYH